MLEDVLRVAVRRGLLILPTMGVPSLARRSGDVLRYESGGPPDLVASAILRELATHQTVRSVSAD